MENQPQNTDQLIDANELASAFESAMNLVQGNNDALPHMMHDTGRLLLKLSRKLSTTQMVLLVGALTLGAVFLVKRLEDQFDDEENSGNRALSAGSGSGSSGGGNSGAGNTGGGNAGGGDQGGAKASRKGGQKGAGSGSQQS